MFLFIPNPLVSLSFLFVIYLFLSIFAISSPAHTRSPLPSPTSPSPEPPALPPPSSLPPWLLTSSPPSPHSQCPPAHARRAGRGRGAEEERGGREGEEGAQRTAMPPRGIAHRGRRGEREDLKPVGTLSWLPLKYGVSTSGIEVLED